MNKPCKDCCQTTNIYGVSLSQLAEKNGWDLGRNDHILAGSDHLKCQPSHCSGHIPVSDPFLEFVLETLDKVCQKS